MAKAGRVRKVFKWFFIGVGALLAPTLAFFAVFIYLFLPIIPGPKFQKPKDSAEAQLQDITYFSTFPKYDKSFSGNDRRVRFDGRIAELKKLAGGMSAGEFELAVARAVALADNTHTNVSPETRSRRLNRLPIRFAQFAEGLFVIHAAEEHADLLGSRVIAFNDVPVEDAMELLLDTFGGSEARARFYAPLTLNSPEIHNALGISVSPQKVSVAFESISGKNVARTLPSLDPDSRRPTPSGRRLLEYVSAAEGWRALMAGQTPPAYLRNPDHPFDVQQVQDGIYVRIDFNYSVEGWPLKSFLADTIETTQETSPEFAVVDLRYNDGGTNTLEGFARDVLRLVSGPVYVIVSPGTFSYGIAAAVMFRYHGGDRVVITGQPVGDRLRFWANGGTTFRLPNSGITLRAWSSLEDYADYRAGRDTVMDTILRRHNAN